ncbi:hypothetical protein H2198_000670 [Neophaeococcomyces mojaviensis]|uniref:Uncharacterized protein n=1 Tax=Neophaeococcomyces mojaviensis TaxID=3383035 RepID=A0ACC3AIZ2_9EURO|nr:hypothetical protein H2198_000670 [Knufia sp. JES_112]
MPGSKSQKSSLAKAFAHNIYETQMHVTKGFRLGDKFELHDPREFRENNKITHNFLDYYINLAMRGYLDTEKQMQEV